MITPKTFRRVTVVAASSCLFVLAAFAQPAFGEDFYTPLTRQHSLQVEANALVPGLPDVQDKHYELSGHGGDLDRFLSASATAGPNGDGASATIRATVQHDITYEPGFIRGTVTCNVSSQETGAHAGGVAAGGLMVEFRMWDKSDLPAHISGRLSGLFDDSKEIGRNAYAMVTMYDLDTEDPDGGPLAIFGRGIGSIDPFEDALDGGGMLLAGHLYRLNVDAYAVREALNNPPAPGTVQPSISGQVEFVLSIPEPASASAGLVGLLLLRRRSAKKRMA